jgi:hypothetical protein
MIERAPRDIPYAQISHAALRDTSLSWKARGVLAYLLSLPDHWEISFPHLVQQSTEDGVSSLRAAFKELVDAGYAKRRYRRSDDHRYADGMRYVISEKKFSEMTETCTSEMVRRRDSVPLKPATIKKNELEEELKEKKNKKDAEPYGPLFLQFWAAYPVKKGKGDAWKVWKRERLDAICEAILLSIPLHHKHDMDWQRGFIKHPATYLNDHCWTDELTDTPRDPSKPRRARV